MTCRCDTGRIAEKFSSFWYLQLHVLIMRQYRLILLHRASTARFDVDITHETSTLEYCLYRIPGLVCNVDSRFG